MTAGRPRRHPCGAGAALRPALVGWPLRRPRILRYRSGRVFAAAHR